MGNSRKKIEKNSINLGEQNALPSFNDKNNDNNKNIDFDDKYIIKDLGINKNVKKKTIFKFNIKLLSIIALFFIIIFTILFSIRFINFNITELVWKINVTKGSDDVNNKSIKYSSFNNGLIRISNDGVTFINEFGELKWTISFNIKDPIYESNGEYFSIADKNGFNFYTFTKNGLAGSNAVANPIQKISLSNDGILYILQSDEENSYINVYRSTGNEIDISIKSTLTGDGMPIDISSSYDGTELVTSSLCLDGEKMYSKATYFNFDEAGKLANSKRIVGEFIEEFNENFLSKVYFFDDKNSCLIFDGGVYFVSTGDPSNPKITKEYSFYEKIVSISYNHDYLVLILENKKMIVFDKTGKSIGEKQLNFEYGDFYIDDNYIIFINEYKVNIFDVKGRMLLNKELEINPQYISKRKNLLNDEIIVGLVDGVECIKFH